MQHEGIRLQRIEAKTPMQSESFIPELPSVKVPKVLLTDTMRWPRSARIAIGLARAGCVISAICPRGDHPLLHTSAVREIFPYSSLRPLDSLIAAIATSKPQIIVPCDDRGVQHLHELYVHADSREVSGSQLKNLIESSLGSHKSYPIVSSRCKLLRIALEEEIRVPDTELLSKAEDLGSWQTRHSLPWVLKGDWTFGGHGVRVARSLDQAAKYFSEITGLFSASRAIKRLIVNRDSFWLRPWWNNQKPAVIVQSYIQGRPANCGVVCWNGKVLSGFAVEVVSLDGSTGPASIVRVIDNSEMMIAAERIARRMELSGFFGLDFMIEHASRAAYLIEMNPRCTPLSHLELGEGRDMIEALSARLSSRAPQNRPPVTQNNTIAYFPQAWQSKSEFLPTSFQDIPEGDDLVEALLRPWPDRTLLYRIGHVLTAAVRQQKASDW